MKRFTIILIALLSFSAWDVVAQPAFLQIVNQSGQSVDVFPAATNAACTPVGVPSPIVVPAGGSTTVFLPASTVTMVRLYPSACPIPPASVTLGSPCSPCFGGGLPSIGTFSDAPCGGGSPVLTATWARCINPGGGYIYQGNLILIQ